MKAIAGNRPMLAMLLIAVLILSGLLLILAWANNRERLEIKATWNVIADFDRTRNSLTTSGVAEDVAYLQLYSHAGLNVKNRHLRMIVEREKHRMVQDIVEALRKKTGEDLGNNPEKWIERHAAAGSTRRN